MCLQLTLKGWYNTNMYSTVNVGVWGSNSIICPTIWHAVQAEFKTLLYSYNKLRRKIMKSNTKADSFMSIKQERFLTTWTSGAGLCNVARVHTKSVLAA